MITRQTVNIFCNYKKARKYEKREWVNKFKKALGGPRVKRFNSCTYLLKFFTKKVNAQNY